MISALRRRYARFRGFDLDGSVVPAMDGPLAPNSALDEARLLGRFADLDNLVADAAGLLGSQGEFLIRLIPGEESWSAQEIARFEASIASLARSPNAALAVGLDGQGVRIQGGRFDGKVITTLGGKALCCPTALRFLDAETLLIAVGSTDVAAAAWKHDLMSLGRSGSLWRVSLATDEARQLAEGLAFPAGVATAADGSIYVSEAWRHRILRIAPDGRTQVVLDQLPAYPGRIAWDGQGFWLALFAPRNQLVEFVLKEPDYRERMVRDIDPALWIAPALRSGASFQAPLQIGGARKLNTLKPWSPSWSYGLVLRCDAAMRPVASYHSRANGGVHGVTSLLPTDGGVMLAARGTGLLLRLDLVQAE
jgi:hypothetical protein